MLDLVCNIALDLLKGAQNLAPIMESKGIPDQKMSDGIDVTTDSTRTKL
jgi:hypothetical protein